MFVEVLQGSIVTWAPKKKPSAGPPGAEPPAGAGGVHAVLLWCHRPPTLYPPLGITFCFCLYQTQEDIKNIDFIKVLRGV